jgi:adhesin/invasin
VATLTVQTVTVAGASVDAVFTTQPVILVTDQFSNPVSGVTVTASRGTGTGVLRGTLTAISAASTGLATFAGLGYNKSGEVFTIHFAAGSVSVNSGSISALSAGAATQVGVETSANGSGSVVGAQSLNAGSTLTVYSITRDQYNNFIANATPDSWTLTGMTGGAAPTDLVGSGASAVMTGHLIGTGIIHAAISGTASTDSGIITVTGGTVDHLLINTQPASTGTLDVVFTTQPTVTAYDIANNPVAGVTIVADRDPATGTGSLRGTLSVTTNASGQAVFTNLGYNRPDAFKVRFTGNTKIIISNQVAPLTVGTVAALTFNTTPVVGASVDAVFTTQPVILVSDQFSNPISGVTVTASRGTGTGVLRGTLTATSAVSTGLATFAGLGYNKSGEAFTIHFAAGTPIADSGSLGPLSAGTATQVRVETIANGSGAVVSAQSLTAGSTLTVYSITRDQYNNFIANTTPDSWSLTSRSGGVASTDLVGSGASAIMTGNLAGTGVIHAVIAGTASTDSGIITVTGGAVDHLVINTQPASTGTLDVVFTTQPTVTAYDIANNPVAGVNIVADRDPATGTGTLRGTLSVTTNASGQAVFTNLGYNRPDAFKVRFTGNTKIIISSQIGALTVGAVATLAINTAPVVGISVDAVLTTQPVILVTDQFNNPVSGVTVTASRGTGTGTLRGTLTATSAVSTGLATFAGLGYNKSGETFTIHFAAGTPIADSSSLGPLSVGAVTQVRVETLANGSGSVAGAQFLGAGSSLTVYSITRDQYNNFVANTAADSWSLTSRTGGVASTDLVGSGASAVMTGHLMGTGIIHAVISGATSTDSGIITVTGGAVDHLVINTQPASTGTLDVLFTTQPTVTAYDVGNNPVGGVSIVADRDPVTGTGGLRGTLSLTTNVSGQVTYTDLGYNRTDAFKVRFTCNTKTIISSQVAALTIGATSQARIETAANGTGSVVGATSLYTGSSLTMFAISRDQFGNFAGNPAGVWTIGTKTGGVTNGNLVQAADGKSAIFTGSAVGTAVIHLVSGTLPAVDSGIITISFPPPPPSDGGGGGIFGPTTVAGVTNISMVIDAQGVFTAQVNAVSDDNKIMFVIWNGTTVKTSDSSILKQISIIHTDTPPAFQTGANLVSLGYNFQPEGLTFNPAAIVRFSYDPALLPAGVSEDSLQIAYYDTTLKGWVTLPSTVDKGSKFITAQITHFSTYAVTYGVKPPPPVVTKTTSTVQPTTVTTSTTTSVATTTATTTTTTTTVATTLSTTTTSTAVITTENKPNAVTSNIIKTTDDNKKGTPSKWLIVGFAVIGLSLITAVIMIIARKKTPPA